MNHLLCKLWRQDEGQDIAEYAVMLAVILVLVVVPFVSSARTPILYFHRQLVLFSSGIGVRAFPFDNGAKR